MFEYHLITSKKPVSRLNKPIQNRLSIFFLIGLLLLSLLSCTIIDPSTSTHTISFKLNGGKFSNPEKTTIEVNDDETIDQTQLKGILSYPPTGPQPNDQSITREIFQWQTNGIEYHLSTLVTSDLILEAVWSNSCGAVETVHPANKTALKEYTDKAIAANSTTNLNHIDTSAITDMDELFKDKVNFNGNIECWNTTKTTSMRDMFAGAQEFDQNVGTWDVSKVTDMSGMFNGASAFNQNIINWDVSKVTNMSSMFNGASTFNQNLKEWVINLELTADKRTDIFKGSAMDGQTGGYPTFDTTHPSVTISTNQSLETGKTTSLSFTFSEEVTEFSSDDIQFLSTGVSAGKGKFITNNPLSYSLEVTPNTSGNLEIKIPANSFEDLYSNKNTEAYNTNFKVFDSPITTTHNISFILNGGKYTSPQITTLQVVDGKAIDQTRLGEILSYPPTSPLSSIEKVTRSIFQWRNKEATYDPSTLVTSDLILEAVWSNSCGALETFHPDNKTELKDYIDQAIAANSTTNLNHINTSAITDMDELFKDKVNFNGNIECWNTTKTTSMRDMFAGAQAFDQNIGTWDVSKVTDIQSMFAGASAFNQNISTWDVSSVTDMSSMFNGAQAFDQNIGTWDVSSVTDMSSMFNGAQAFDQNIGTWDVSKVTDMSSMFNGAQAFDQDIGNWVVSSVTDMSSMFNGAQAFDQNIGTWDVSSVTDMSSMFNGAQAFDQNIGTWVVSSVTDMSSMFNGAQAFDQDIGNWVVSSVTDMSSMFNGAQTFDQNIGTWDVSSVTDMSSMFNGAQTFDQNLREWKINPELTPDKRSNMFKESAMDGKTGVYPTTFDTTNSSVTITIKSETLIEKQSAYLSFIFSEEVTEFTSDDIQFLSTGVSAGKGKFITNNPLSYSLEVTPQAVGDLKITIPAKSFKDLADNQNTEAYNTNFPVLASTTTTHTISFKLNGGEYTSPQITSLKVVDGKTIDQTQLGGILSYPSTGPQPNDQAVTRSIAEWRSEEVTYNLSTPVTSDLTLDAVWSNSCGKVETFHPANKTALQDYINKAIADNSTTNLNHIDTSAITIMNYLFAGRNNSFNGEISCWNTTKVTNMQSMFATANAFNGDISKWDVSSVINMQSMFWVASAFNGDISKWNVSKVTDMQSMFNGANAFNQNIGTWDVSKVINMRAMFLNASAFNGDISKWNVSKVTDMQSMFSFSSHGAFDRDISSWDVSSVTNMQSMFAGANDFNQNIGKWDVSSVTDMQAMFLNASAFNGDISEWDISSVTDMQSMFSGAQTFDQNIGTWNVSKVTDMSYMFNNATVFDQNLSEWVINEELSADKRTDIFTGSPMNESENEGKHPTFPIK